MDSTAYGDEEVDLDNMPILPPPSLPPKDPAPSKSKSGPKPVKEKMPGASRGLAKAVEVRITSVIFKME